jgi:hypothetical protein
MVFDTTRVTIVWLFLFSVSFFCLFFLSPFWYSFDLCGVDTQTLLTSVAQQKLMTHGDTIEAHG